MARLSEQLALLSSSTAGLLESSSSQEENAEQGLVRLDDTQLVERTDKIHIGETELSSPESSVVETEKIPGFDIDAPS